MNLYACTHTYGMNKLPWMAYVYIYIVIIMHIYHYTTIMYGMLYTSSQQLIDELCCVHTFVGMGND